MAGYKVSYKILRQQGEDIKSTAKLVDGYAERVGQIRGRLGSDGLLADVRGNLQKLQGQLGESRAVLNAAGEFLVKTVDGYSGTETRQVKKVDGTKAHNRDFYKNPVVVASAGGAAAGAAAVGAAGAVAPPPAAPAAATVNYTDNTVNYTDNSVNVTYVAPESAAGAVVPEAQPVAAQTVAPQTVAAAQPVSAPASAPTAASVTAAPPPSAAPAAAQSGPNGLGAVAGSVLGGAAAAGAVTGGIHLKKKHDAEKASAAAETAADGYDPEAELEKAIARVRELGEQDTP
ncbi:MAG: hypothetical protein LBC78_03620 [Oscillospiraceae bacterium]|jgi:hypothetical protein|nr:hypothetical protein [Oscillospiraceae bacterium]